MVYLEGFPGGLHDIDRGVDPEQNTGEQIWHINVMGSTEIFNSGSVD